MESNTWIEVIGSKRTATEKISDILALKAFQSHIAGKKLEDYVFFPDEFICEDEKVLWKCDKFRDKTPVKLLNAEDSITKYLLELMKEVKACFGDEKSFSENLSVQVLADKNGKTRFDLISQEAETEKTTFHSWLKSMYAKFKLSGYENKTIEDALQSNPIDLDKLAKEFE